MGKAAREAEKHGRGGAESVQIWRGCVFQVQSGEKRTVFFPVGTGWTRVFSPRSRAVGIEVDCYYPRRVLHARRGDLWSWTIENLHQWYAAWVTKRRRSGARPGDERFDRRYPRSRQTGERFQRGNRRVASLERRSNANRNRAKHGENFDGIGIRFTRLLAVRRVFGMARER